MVTWNSHLIYIPLGKACYAHFIGIKNNRQVRTLKHDFNVC
jgi:hypothetical protein